MEFAVELNKINGVAPMMSRRDNVSTNDDTGQNNMLVDAEGEDSPLVSEDNNIANSDDGSLDLAGDDAVTDEDEVIESPPQISSDDDSIDLANGGLIQVIRLLLQRQPQGDLRVRLRNDSDGESSEDEGYSIHNFLTSRRFNDQRIPQPPDSPDTSVLDNSELRQQMQYQLGSLQPNKSKHSCNFASVPGLLCMKEIGGLSNDRSISLGRRVQAASSYLPTKHNPRRLLRLCDKIFCGVYNKEGDLFMSASQDSKIRIFDTSNGQWTKIKEIDCKDVGWSVLDVDFSHCGNNIIYSSWSEYIHLCNIRGDCETHQALFLDPDDIHNRSGVFSIRFSSDDRDIIAGANRGLIYMFNRDVGKCTMKLHAHDDDLSSVCFADNTSHILYSGGEDGVIKVWDRRTLREDAPLPVGQLAGHYDSVTHIDSRNDSRYLLTNSKDQSIKLWDIRRFASSEGINATKNSVAKQNWDYRWHPYVGKIVKKKLAGDCSLMTYFGHSVVRTLIRARFSPASNTAQRYIYCGDGFGRVVVYDLLSGKIARILEGNTDPHWTIGHDRHVVRDVSWHPYDNNIVSSGWDGTLNMWQYNSGSSYPLNS